MLVSVPFVHARQSVAMENRTGPQGIGPARLFFAWVDGFARAPQDRQKRLKQACAKSRRKTGGIAQGEPFTRSLAHCRLSNPAATPRGHFNI